MTLSKRFGSLVAAHRRRRGLSQQQLAEAAQLSPDMISRIETGGTGARFPTIERLAAALSVDAAELFSTTATADRDMRPALLDITASLSKLSDGDLIWIADLMHAALRTKPQRTRVAVNRERSLRRSG